eukprot:CAMPEP_0173169360 /NCGR_PEP_ID=MMETSP1141-20130122/663_1 /TAXON_ID=483371 /ORGANISM="non described non described, Strain CCMP2298" /LENGTH=54 /DNA_ID=CAMNT_0014091183 /DNA_START=137 /DNA_END=301 /DNA_ORIENTATION=+
MTTLSPLSELLMQVCPSHPDPASTAGTPSSGTAVWITMEHAVHKLTPLSSGLGD